MALHTHLSEWQRHLVYGSVVLTLLYGAEAHIYPLMVSAGTLIVLWVIAQNPPLDEFPATALWLASLTCITAAVYISNLLLLGIGALGLLTTDAGLFSQTPDDED